MTLPGADTSIYFSISLFHVKDDQHFGANALSDLSLSTRDIYINYIPIDCSGDALSHETIRHQIGVCFPNLPK